jgi:predicted nucleotide-binding protein
MAGELREIEEVNCQLTNTPNFLQVLRPRTLELGYFAAKLGRARVFPLYRDVANLELPSDIAGVLYSPYDAPGKWQLDLARELKACGYDVDANKLV